MKKCNRCFILKPFTDFYLKSRYSDGYDYTCKICLAPGDAARREKKRIDKAAGIKRPKRLIIWESNKTKNIKNGFKEHIRKYKVRLFLKQITEEEFQCKIRTHQLKLKQSIQQDKDKYKEKLIRKEEKRLIREKKLMEKRVIRQAQVLERKKNKALASSWQSKYEREKRKNNSLYRLICNLRHRTNMALKKGGFTKKSSLSQYLGCTMEEFKKHLESLFQSGMTWANYGNGSGLWNMDHIIPLASANSTEEIHLLCHYSNVRPMWSILNSIKNNKTLEEWEIHKLEHKIDESVPPSVANAPKS